MLKPHEEYLQLLDCVLSQNPELEVKVKELEEIFMAHPAPMDIAVILNQGLRLTYLLARNLEKNNLVLFRPQTTHGGTKQVASLTGIVNPNREILLFDDDMKEGSTMVEGYTYFSGLGYRPDKIFCYIVFGDYYDNEAKSITGLVRDIFIV